MPLKPVRAFQILSRTSAESVEEVAPVVDKTGAGVTSGKSLSVKDVLKGASKSLESKRPRSRIGRKYGKRTPSTEVAKRPPRPESERVTKRTNCNADFLPPGVGPTDGDGKQVRTIYNATADEIIAYTGGKGPIVIVDKKGKLLHPRSLLILLRERVDWKELEGELKEKFPDFLKGTGLREDRLARVSEEAAQAVTTAIQQGYVPPLMHRSQALHDPDHVADALEVQHFDAGARVKLLLDIAYDESLRGSDRLQALEIIDKTVVRCGRIVRAAQTSWQGVVERSVMEGVIRGDKSALEIAIASGKADGFKLPERTTTPGTAVQVNVSGASVDPFAGLSPEKRARLTEIDVMLGQAPLPVIDKITETQNVDADAGQDSSTP